MGTWYTVVTVQKRSGKQGPRDLNEIAFRVTGEAVGDMKPKHREKKTSGRAGGLIGGKARAAKLTPEQRSEISKLAAQARWKKS